MSYSLMICEYARESIPMSPQLYLLTAQFDDIRRIDLISASREPRPEL